MPETPGRPGFNQIYQQQFRQISTSRTSRAFRVITPTALLAVALLTRLTPHSPVITIIFGALAVILFAVMIVLTRRQRRNPAAPSPDAQKAVQQPAPAITDRNTG